MHFKMTSPYKTFIRSLSNNDINNLYQGKLCLCVNDNEYILCDSGLSLQSTALLTEFTHNLLHNQELILKDLYQTYPLCKDEFYFQARQLFEQHGPAQFCQQSLSTDNMALMIDDHELIAIDSNDPRNQYGYYFSHPSIIDKEQATVLVNEWLNSGEAYNDYRVKTHCRYICK